MPDDHDDSTFFDYILSPDYFTSAGPPTRNGGRTKAISGTPDSGSSTELGVHLDVEDRHGFVEEEHPRARRRGQVRGPRPLWLPAPELGGQPVSEAR